MKAATSKEIKEELRHLSPDDLIKLCMRLLSFKKENKELVTYLLFQSSNEQDYVRSVKEEIDNQFLTVNKKTPYLMKKGMRSILKNVKKYIRYSNCKETEVELLLYFCSKMKTFSPSIDGNRKLTSLFETQLSLIKKKVLSLHEDLQYDFGLEIDDLENKL